MTSKGIYEKMQQDLIDQQKRFVVLLDPDKIRLQNLDKIIKLANETKVDYFFIGGSLVVNDVLDSLLMDIKKECNIPLILFPGNSSQLSYKADGLLFLSLISGRNADLLIGKNVVSAPFLKISPLEILSTGYMLIDGGVPTTVSYISNTYPIPSNKEDIAVCTAIAGEMLGLKLIFMDAGSGAEKPVSTQMIESVKGAIQIPLIVGGGIKTAEKVRANIEAGADIIVVGDAIEKDPQLIRDMALATKS